MRFTVSSEQLKFFYDHGCLGIEELLQEEEALLLLKAIRAALDKSPGYTPENLYRSLPQVTSLIHKRGWGQIASELIKKRPLRIVSDHYFANAPQLATVQIDEESCGILVNLQNRSGIFFKDPAFKKALYNTDESCYFLLILTANRLPERLHPIVYRSRHD